MDEKHSEWAQYTQLIEACINETYHDTIEITPYEGQFGKKHNTICITTALWTQIKYI